MKTSKGSISLGLAVLVQHYIDQEGIDDTNGWAQVDGKGEAANRTYGQYIMASNIVDWIEDGTLAKIAETGIVDDLW